MSTNNKKRIKLYESTDYVGNSNIVNEYIYFTESKYSNGNYDFRYCRIKTDGTGLEKQDKPFEWFY